MATGLSKVKWIVYFMVDNTLLKFQTKLISGPETKENVSEEGVFLHAPQEPGTSLTHNLEVVDQSLIHD